MKIFNKTRGITLALILFSTPFLKPQNYELGVFGGVSNYQGDLADGIFQPKESQPAGGLVVRYSPSSFLAVRLGFMIGTIKGDDANSKDPNIRERGYTFTSNIRELGLSTEFHLPYYGVSNYGIFRPKFSPFVFVGGCITSLNGQPKAPSNRVPYPFPEFEARSEFLGGMAGGGFKFQFAQNFATSIEWGTRTVFNDYLDGISKNGNPKRNDWYMFGGITLTYVVDGGDDNPYRGRKGRKRR